MFIEFVLIFLMSMLTEIFLQSIWMAKMHGLKIEQVTKLYGPSWHEKTKMGTPTMGGIVFIPVLVLSLCAAGYIDKSISFEAAVRIVTYPVLAAAVGFLDDWLKYSRHSSDGLKSMEKLLLQAAVTIPWAVWAVPGSLELLPGFVINRIAAVVLVAFAGIGLQNAVNVTDGLDGLAAGCSFISFAGALVFLGGEPAVTMTIASACGICLGFLWHNANPASVFMGDVGAHFFAGLLLSLCVYSGFLLLIIPLGFIFGVEIISVAIQIIAIRKFKKKIFLMSPVHHHFEMLGWKETQIVTRFWIVHIAGMCLCMVLLFLLVFWV
ncbi:MAG: phospho-N-acetylmuramoyl-pentapeptide-transferase [Synergistaceae bacterium]|nr:phospho-N-acetylmuramoyl-pentapeptide-transferase [Synergistaceae bacterium]